MTGGAVRILIVEDEPLIRWAMAETLSKSGYLVAEAANAREVIEQMDRGDSPDVVFLDFRLPDSDDLRLLTAIKQRAPTCAVVMMTAFATPEMIHDAEALGAARVVGKPIEMTELPQLACESIRMWAQRGMVVEPTRTE